MEVISSASGISVGDKVQIRAGGIDVTNGKSATAGKMYGAGGPLWATVTKIVSGWSTGGKWGLPSSVDKVVCSAGSVVVWQVQPSDCINSIKQVSPATVSTVAVTNNYVTYKAPTYEDYIQSISNDTIRNRYKAIGYGNTTVKYAPHLEAQGWVDGSTTTQYCADNPIPTPVAVTTQVGSKSPFLTQDNTVYEDTGNDTIKITSRTAYQDLNKRRVLLNEDVENIQNGMGFPDYKESSNGLLSAKYDYQIIPGDNRYPKMVSLENKLTEVRASLGLTAHGDNDISRAIKYFTYNRWHTPSVDLAHNKSFTYVFFTRPDLNIWDYEQKCANAQVINHSDTSILWRTNPDLFKLLVDSKRTGDDNNFNLLLSNQVTSFDMIDETLSYNSIGESWSEYSIQYGNKFDGNKAGQFTCSFTELQDYSVIKLIKLWMTYIHKVSTGAWGPSYNLYGNSTGWSKEMSASHVYTKTLDYAASAYVFKCGPDGENVIYWTKYFGVFPISSGASSLAWDLDSGVGSTPKPNITFRYSTKRDMSPISLLEFNHNARVPDEKLIYYQDAYSANNAMTSRPIVGCPFIEIDIGNANPSSGAGLPSSRQKRTEIRLKFKKSSASALTDRIMFSSALDR